MRTATARSRDDIVVYEVMAQVINRKSWRNRRLALEKAFGQDEIVIRSIQPTRL